MKNKETARQLHLIAQHLSLTDESPFKIRAYEKAAQVIEAIPEPIEDIAKDFGKLSSIRGVGRSIAAKIVEYLSSGGMERLRELKEKFPPGVFDMLKIPGLGPKRVKVLYKELGIKDIDTLKQYAESHRIKDIPGFGERAEKNILDGINFAFVPERRLLLFEALSIVDGILRELKKNANIVNIEPCGSIRRRKETIGDVDMLCCVKRGKEKEVIEKFARLPHVKKVLACGGTKGSVITAENFQVDLRVVPENAYGSALQYFTGSKQHNIRLREFANKKGLTISEYGVFEVGDKSKPIAGRTEEELYKILGLDYIAPELREDRGEIESAAKGKLPELVELKDIKGDIHVHSNYSDGANTIKEIADYAERLNYEWVIVCDHSQSLKVARGVQIRDLYRKIDEVKKVNKTSRVRVLCGAEVDILSGGKLDYPDEVLKELDFVIAALHTGFRQSEEQITGRVLKAMDNKYVHAFAHPTGRLLNKRDGYEINLSKVIEHAFKSNTCIEINAYPERLDLDDINSKHAKERGVKLAIGTDAHHVSQMEYMSLGIYVARRGWLEEGDVVNTIPYLKLLKFLKSKR